MTATSSCSLTLRLDQGLFEQPKAISQVRFVINKSRPSLRVFLFLDYLYGSLKKSPRLDFNAFSIGQPNAEGVCATDVFQVTGATNRVPRICGDNSGQHSIQFLAISVRSECLVVQHHNFVLHTLQCTWTCQALQLDRLDRFRMKLLYRSTLGRCLRLLVIGTLKYRCCLQALVISVFKTR